MCAPRLGVTNAGPSLASGLFWSFLIPRPNILKADEPEMRVSNSRRRAPSILEISGLPRRFLLSGMTDLNWERPTHPPPENILRPPPLCLSLAWCDGGGPATRTPCGSVCPRGPGPPPGSRKRPGSPPPQVLRGRRPARPPLASISRTGGRLGQAGAWARREAEQSTPIPVPTLPESRILQSESSGETWRKCRSPARALLPEGWAPEGALFHVACKCRGPATQPRSRARSAQHAGPEHAGKVPGK